MRVRPFIHKPLFAGVIVFYELWIRGLQDADGQRNPREQRIFRPVGQYDPLNPEETILEAPATSYNVTQLQPFTVYEFQVIAENEAGRAASDWTPGRTQEACKCVCVCVCVWVGGWVHACACVCVSV